MDEQLFNQKPDDTQEPKTAGQPYDEKQAEAPAETTSTHAADIPANEAPAAPAKDAAAAPESEPASENPSPAALKIPEPAPAKDSWQNAPAQNPQNLPNGYGQLPPSQAPWQFNQPQPQNNPYSSPYNQNRQSIQKPPANNMAVISLTLGIISMLLSCCCILPMGFIIGFALGMGGLVTAILSKNGQPFTGTAVAGLVISILGICLSLFIFGCYMLTAYMMRDPNYAAMIQQLMEQYQNSIAPQTIPFFLDKLF